MSTVDTRFDAPAPDVLRTAKSRAAFADALRGRPGEWALLGQQTTRGTAGQDAYEIRRGLRPANAGFTAGEFEAEAKTLFGEHRVYVRYVGGAR
ncbi:hypothetical protein K378_01372 [Streptomyces sp. Amel2xB2]|uniref:hypothetical protein n=1 Tax=Streptomyces sp. Amel2xB2 TaxID=1305829 RepID=UPI000DBA02CF|nr:hypothetical protein [Streptomyces sp. Amel2xB2]RAJ70207.1 hypothetical protein K378_01372 [Streptomyces sp. Amel2xB2]